MAYRTKEELKEMQDFYRKGLKGNRYQKVQGNWRVQTLVRIIVPLWCMLRACKHLCLAFYYLFRKDIPIAVRAGLRRCNVWCRDIKR